ncbi:hypothetical protein Y032_0296g1681 [Ancylostoma ceylanicum]|uniref:Uncharacterized protein n=1 Tax=Ancylostoma ceylanicum TaxID=53326 RepID=A0A016S5B6_9BILA|nr:hypothetical protein Y032_0296g1681 [Ancylostoma ceylanicum]
MWASALIWMNAYSVYIQRVVQSSHLYANSVRKAPTDFFEDRGINSILSQFKSIRNGFEPEGKSGVGFVSPKRWSE